MAKSPRSPQHLSKIHAEVGDHRNDAAQLNRGVTTHSVFEPSSIGTTFKCAVLLMGRNFVSPCTIPAPDRASRPPQRSLELRGLPRNGSREWTLCQAQRL